MAGPRSRSRGCITHRHVLSREHVAFPESRRQRMKAAEFVEQARLCGLSDLTAARLQQEISAIAGRLRRGEISHRRAYALQEAATWEAVGEPCATEPGERDPIMDPLWAQFREDLGALHAYARVA